MKQNLKQNQKQNPNSVTIIDESSLLPEGAAELIQKAAAVALETEGAHKAYFTLSAVSEDEIRKLNFSMRGVDSVTDVLSFPNIRYPEGKTLGDAPGLLKKAYDPGEGRYFLGDVALCAARARKQAEEYGHAFEREAAYLTVHAALHLCGYDHMTESDRRKMRDAEKAVMRELKLFRHGGGGMNGNDINDINDKNTEECIALAEQALEFSYSPYSRFRVGACLVSADGRRFQGANFENASYGATICAERCAVSNALIHGAKRFTKIFIACDEGYAWPCGICRQVLNEFKAGDMEIWVGSPVSEWKMKPLSALLPESFGPEELGIKAQV